MKSHMKIQIQKLSSILFSTITVLYIFPVNALVSTPSWKNAERKRFNAYYHINQNHAQPKPLNLETLNLGNIFLSALNLGNIFLSARKYPLRKDFFKFDP